MMENEEVVEETPMEAIEEAVEVDSFDESAALLEGAQATIMRLETSLAELSGEVTRLKAHNYELLMMHAGDPAPADEPSEEEGEGMTFAELFA
jgi:cellobiose-specific phosphotransferase system component IIA